MIMKQEISLILSVFSGLDVVLQQLYLRTINRKMNAMAEMFDRDRTMTINVYEFRDLFNYINQWKALFEGIDRDRSGFIEFGELQQGESYRHH